MFVSLAYTDGLSNNFPFISPLVHSIEKLCYGLKCLRREFCGHFRFEVI